MRFFLSFSLFYVNIHTYIHEQPFCLKLNSNLCCLRVWNVFLIILFVTSSSSSCSSSYFLPFNFSFHIFGFMFFLNQVIFLIDLHVWYAACEHFFYPKCYTNIRFDFFILFYIITSNIFTQFYEMQKWDQISHKSERVWLNSFFGGFSTRIHLLRLWVFTPKFWVFVGLGGLL